MDLECFHPVEDGPSRGVSKTDMMTSPRLFDITQAEDTAAWLAPSIVPDLNMKGFNFSALPRWTCRHCAQAQNTTRVDSQHTRPSKKIRGFTTVGRTKPSSPLTFSEGFALGRRVGRSRNFQVTVGVVVLLGGAGYYFKDGILYATGAVQRTSRVAGALYLNIVE